MRIQVRLNLLLRHLFDNFSDIGAVAPVAGDNLVPGGRVGAEYAPIGFALLKQLFRLLGGQLVGRQIGGNIGAHGVRDFAGFGIDSAFSLKVGAEFTHAQHNAVSNADRVNIASINITQIIHDRLEPAFLLHPAAEVEVAQPLHTRFFAAGNAVKVFFHLRGELVVHVGAETGFEQAHHRERSPRRHERTGTHLHIAAIHNR